MPPIKAEKVRKSLVKKGFVHVAGHHHFFEYYKSGKLITSTKTSHNGQEIDDFLLGAMSKQCRVGRDFFKRFLECSKSQSDYEEELHRQGLL